MSTVKVSVITVNLNNREGLRRTMESVRSQTAPVEFVVVDGGSVDGSVELIKQAAPEKWLNEKDHGIYDAMNKGIGLATGDYLIFMNSGDVFYSNEVIRRFTELAGGHKIVYGNSEILEGGKRSLLTPPSPIDLQFWYRRTLNHQAVFTHRDVFAQYGKFDVRYRTCADFDLLLKVFMKESGSFHYFPETVCSYDQSGFSASAGNYDAMLAERQQILVKEVPAAQLAGMKQNYLRGLPFKQRLKHRIYERPLLKRIFLSLYGK